MPQKAKHKRNKMEKLLSPIKAQVFLIMSLFVAFSAFSQEKQLSNALKKTSQTSFDIRFYPEKGMFPNTWYSSPINAETTALEDSAEQQRSIKILEKAAALYPAWLLEKSLDKVYVLSSLSFYGVAYGGTYSYSKKSIWIVNKGIRRGYDEAFLSRLFHAEFSSILLEEYKHLFDITNFEKTHDPAYSYGKGGVDALKTQKSSEAYNEEINAAGFLNMYGMSDSENDLNSFAKRLFYPDDEFWEVVEKYPYLQSKLKIVIDFYHAIDPVFTLEYFKSIH
jgi:hypothetical protein